jgi:RNA 3'-terminal phosphate cyclase-like protein
MAAKLTYEGCAHFRARIAASSLSGKKLKIENIRSSDFSAPGLQDFEASYLRLIDKVRGSL